MKFNPRKLVEDLDTKAGIASLLKIIKDLDTKGREVILKTISSSLTEAQKQQALSTIKGLAGNTDKAVRDWLVQGISTSYISGTNQVVKNLRSIGFKKPSNVPDVKPLTVQLISTVPEFQPHLKAVNALLNDAYLDFGNTMTGYVKSSERILNDALKRQIRSTIAEGRLEGSAVREISKTVKSAFEDKGFAVLLDKGGRTWSLENYSQMITRTHLLKANNEGVINRASDFKIDIVEVSSHGADDEVCAAQEGKIYSISGKSEVYEPLGDNEPPFHPNCRHTLLLRPDLS